MANKEVKEIIYIVDNEVVSTKDVLDSYPLENKDEWTLLSENNLCYLIARNENPINDPWMRTMKRWSFDKNDIHGKLWIFASGRSPSFFTTDSFSSMCYTTINKKIVKLWRNCN